MAQNNFQILNKDDESKYPLKSLTFYKMSEFNESLGYFIEKDKLLVLPNTPAAEHSIIISKNDFDENRFPLLKENDTPAYKCKDFMSKDDFEMENILKVADQLSFSYNQKTFYEDAEQFVKKADLEDKELFYGIALFFIGEDLRKLSNNIIWQFDTLYFFCPYIEVTLYESKNNLSFHDLNLLIEDKIVNNKKITFKDIYKRIERYYNKKKQIFN